MASQRPSRGKVAVQVTKGSVGGGTTGNARLSKPVTSGPASKQTASTSTLSASKASKPVTGHVPNGTLKRSAVSSATSNSAAQRSATRKATTASTSTRPPATDSKSSSATPVPTAGSSSGQAPASVDLQEAAQIYSWMYMASTLESTRENTEKTVLAELQSLSQQLAAEEVEIADARTRHRAEQLLGFYEEVSQKESLRLLRSLTVMFLRHEADCASVTSKVMKLIDASHYDSVYLRTCNTLLSSLASLLSEADLIEFDSLNLLNLFQQENSKIRPILHGIISVIRSRITSLSQAHTLVQAQKDITRMAFEMQSLRLIA